MSARRSAIWALALCLLFGWTILGATCGGDDDDDSGDDTAQDEAAIRAIVEEMIDGYAQRTVEALDEKIMPHISADYDYAGLDREGMRDDFIRQLEEDEGRLTIPSYEIASIEITLDGDAAVAHALTEFQLEMALEEGIDGAPLVGAATNDGIFEFAREADGWMVRAIRTGEESQARLSSGEAPYLPEPADDFALPAAQTIAAGASLSLAGGVTFPEVAEDMVALARFELDWNPFTVNLALHDADGESALGFEIPEEGGLVDVAGTLPDDGRPEGLTIPSDFPPGTDAVTASFWAYVVDISADEPAILGAVVLNHAYPLEGFTNGWSCENVPTAGPQGIWRFDFEATAWIPYPQLLDLTIAGSEVLASILWYQPADGEDPARIAGALLDGTADQTGFSLSLTTEGEDCPDPEHPEITLTWTGTFNGTGIDDGELLFEGCNFPPDFSQPFIGQKITNRCDYLRGADEAEGDWIVKVTGQADQTISLAYDPEDPQAPFTFELSGVEYGGVYADNRILAMGTTDPEAVVALVFDDDETGTVFWFGDPEVMGTLERAD